MDLPVHSSLENVTLCCSLFKYEFEIYNHPFFTGEPLTYINWIPGRKSNYYYNSAENCVALLPYKQGMWDDIPCGEFYLDKGNGYAENHKETHPYICEYGKSLTVTVLNDLILI